MKRLAWIASWKRVGLHAGLLAGLGLAFVGVSEKPATAQADECPSETGCSFKKPNILLVMDWSSSMNWVFEANTLPTGMEGDRWAAAENAVLTMLDSQNGFFDDNLHFALMRFGSQTPCSLGAANVLDVGWYDDQLADKTYYECNGQAIKDALENSIPDPPLPGVNGCLTWTGAALGAARDYIDQSKADHPEDLTPMAERYYGVIVVTDGAWNGPGGEDPRDPADDPAPIAADLYSNDDIPTYVIAMSAEADALADADALAAAGGTMAALDGSSSAGVETAMQTIIDDIRNSVIIPTCIEGQPRVMIVLDASSSMLQGDRAGRDTGWDQARAALAGTNSIFDVEINMGESRAEDLMLLGLTVFGGEMPAEEKLLVQYGPCMKDNFAWALDPLTACGPGGNCTDPWTQAPPINWDFKTSPPSTFNGAPPFNVVTRNHLPQCQSSGAGSCSGSATFTHRGLEMTWDNLRWYKQNTLMTPPFPTGPSTEFINILITDGNYTGYSTDAEVRNSLQVMEQGGVTTYVIGFGDNISQNLLDNMADWGSGGTVAAFDASTQADLEASLAQILENLNFDPCCELNDCAMTPEVDYDSDTFGATDGDVPDFPETTGGSGGSDGTTGGGGSDGTTGGGSGGSDGTTGGGSGGSTSGGSGGSTSGGSGGGSTGDGSGGSTGDGSGGGSTGDGSGGSTGDGSGNGSDGGDGDGDGDGDSETDGSTDGGGDGCDCSAGNSDGGPRGLLGSLVLLGLGGVIRRRRSA